MDPKAHCVATLNGCHQDAVHQGHDHTLSLLQEHFWSLGMTDQVQKSLKSCSHIPIHPIVSTAQVHLLHVDFTNIENDHAAKHTTQGCTTPWCSRTISWRHMMAYVTPNQTAKTVAKFLYRVTSWSLELVERSHQTIMQMIRKLGEEEKANWLGHLTEIVHAYNATLSTVMGYSLHYLMFGCRSRLPVDFYFPTSRSAEVPKWGTSVKHVDEYVAAVQDYLRASLQEAQPNLWQKLKDRNGIMTERLAL